jgi:hypothetical protein
MDVENVLVVIKYLWPLGVLFGVGTLIVQVYGFYISYDGFPSPRNRSRDADLSPRRG